MRLAGWTLLILPFVGADASAQPMVEMVRDLNAMQNRIVTGDAAAREQAARQFDHIEKSIVANDAEFLSEERNARAAIIYLLCGGGIGQLRAIIEAGRVHESLAPLFESSLQYAEGAPAAAKALLAFDARQYPPALGGHLALVQAGALIGADNPKAIALLDLARLLMPGTLVEEAALRREIAILDSARDADKLGLLAVRYATKYANSPFARQFWSLLPGLTLRVPATPLFASRLAIALEKAPPSDRADFYLSLSRRALLAGNFEEAGKAIDKAGADSSNQSARLRAATYRSILSALEDKQSLSTLRNLPTAGLSADDLQLVKIAASLGAKFEAPVERKAAAAGAVPPADEAGEMETHVRRAIAQTDELLERAEHR